jgi:DNA-binding MarR family transcriptional regulator
VNGHLALYIPYEIWHSKKFTQTEKLIFGRIYYFSLKGEARACLESNGKLAEVFQVHKDTVRSALRKLEKDDWIKKGFRHHQRQLKLSERCQRHFAKPPTEWD